MNTGLSRKVSRILLTAGMAAALAVSGCGASEEETMMIVQAETEKTLGEGETAESWISSQEYEDWLQEKEAEVEASLAQQDSMYPFYEQTMQAFLRDEGENVVYSPVNVYIALSMLAECTAGSTRQELLDLLNAQDAAELENRVNAVWSAVSADNPVVTTTLANSMWLDQRITFRKEVLETLANSYHASSYGGDLSSLQLNQALKDWINDNTGHLLEEQADGLEMDDSVILALVSTLYLKASWQNAFDPDETQEETFYGPDGEQTVSMMHAVLPGSVYQGSGFRAVELGLSDCGSMWIFLPDEQDGVGDLAGNADVYALLQEPNSWPDVQSAEIQLSLPKFDVFCQLDLMQELQRLGVSEIFTDSADFSPLTDADAFVSMLEHAARVKTDEEGVEAAAFTIAMVKITGAMETEIVAFQVDHPFLFVLTGEDHSILFTGIVNQPAE